MGLFKKGKRIICVPQNFCTNLKISLQTEILSINFCTNSLLHTLVNQWIKKK